MEFVEQDVENLMKIRLKFVSPAGASLISENSDYKLNSSKMNQARTENGDWRKLRVKVQWPRT